MDKLNLQNPVFATYVIAATVMILKAVGMSWLTVVRMTEVKGGYRSPEDIRKTRLNPDPNPAQLAPNERVERIRRIQLNDLENLPFFLVAGLLFVLTAPSLALTQWLLYGYVALAAAALCRLFHRADPRYAGHPVDRGLADPDLHHGPDAGRGPRILTRSLSRSVSERGGRTSRFGPDRTTYGGRYRSDLPKTVPSNFPRIEITGISPPNVSSQASRRNNSPLHETIFCFSCRHPETLAN